MIIQQNVHATLDQTQNRNSFIRTGIFSVKPLLLITGFKGKKLRQLCFAGGSELIQGNNTGNKEDDP